MLACLAAHRVPRGDGKPRAFRQRLRNLSLRLCGCKSVRGNTSQRARERDRGEQAQKRDDHCDRAKNTPFASTNRSLCSQTSSFAEQREGTHGSASLTRFLAHSPPLQSLVLFSTTRDCTLSLLALQTRAHSLWHSLVTLARSHTLAQARKIHKSCARAPRRRLQPQAQQAVARRLGRSRRSHSH